MSEREPRAPQIAGILALHRIEASGPGEVSCHACRDKGWMDGGTYFQHVADAVLRVVDAYAEQVRAAERERIAQAIEAAQQSHEYIARTEGLNLPAVARVSIACTHAAAIARAGGEQP